MTYSAPASLARYDGWRVQFCATLCCVHHHAVAELGWNRLYKENLDIQTCVLPQTLPAVRHNNLRFAHAFQAKNFKVVVRFRPMNSKERAADEKSCVEVVKGQSITITKPVCR